MVSIHSQLDTSKIDLTISLKYKYHSFIHGPPICLLLASLFSMQRPSSQILVFTCDPTLRTHPDFLVCVVVHSIWCHEVLPPPCHQFILHQCIQLINQPISCNLQLSQGTTWLTSIPICRQILISQQRSPP